MNLLLWKGVVILSCLSSLLLIHHLLGTREMTLRIARVFFWLAYICQSVVIMFVWAEFGKLPLFDTRSALKVFSWLIMSIYLIVEKRFNVVQTGIVILPLAVAMWGLGGPYWETKSLPPFFHSGWLTVHGILCLLGEGSLAVAFSASMLYLWHERAIRKKKALRYLERFPSLESLDEVNYRCVALGFLLLTAGIVSGAIWAHEAWGAYWMWQAKENLALATWLVYAGLLHQRLNSGWRGRRGAIISVMGFVLVVFTFVGGGFLGSGPHTFGRLWG